MIDGDLKLQLKWGWISDEEKKEKLDHEREEIQEDNNNNDNSVNMSSKSSFFPSFISSFFTKSSQNQSDPTSHIINEEEENIPINIISLTQQVRSLQIQSSSHHHHLSAHSQTLNQLVSGEVHIPSLIWFIPRKESSWRKIMGNPRSWFEDEVMLVFLCGYGHCVVECGPEGEGYLVRNPKEWVRRWAPAIQASLWLLKGLSMAGKFVGIPLPEVDVGGISRKLGAEEAFEGLRGSLEGCGFNVDDGVDQVLDSMLEANESRNIDQLVGGRGDERKVTG